MQPVFSCSDRSNAKLGASLDTERVKSASREELRVEDALLSYASSARAYKTARRAVVIQARSVNWPSELQRKPTNVDRPTGSVSYPSC